MSRFDFHSFVDLMRAAVAAGIPRDNRQDERTRIREHTRRSEPLPRRGRLALGRDRGSVGDFGLHDTLAQAGRREPAPRPAPRFDQPTTRSSAGGLLSRALLAADPLHAAEALRDFRVFRGANDARWTTWCKICEAWKIDPVPLSTDVIEKVGASLRKGGYRSSAQYFSRARKEHVQVTGMPVPAPVEIAIRDAIKIH